MYIETRSGGNLLAASYARATAHNPAEVNEAPEWALYIMFVFFLSLSGFAVYQFSMWTFSILDQIYKQRPILSSVLTVVAALSLGGFAYWVREVGRSWFVYPPAEIGLGIGLALLAVHGSGGPVISILAFLAAVRVVLDGINRLITFRREDRKRKRDAAEEQEQEREALLHSILDCSLNPLPVTARGE